MQHPAAGPAALTGYIASITAANWLTARYGMVDVGLGLVTTAGTFAAGAALLLRDTVQDTLGRRWVLAGIAAGATLTAITSPVLAVASTAAFLAAELADMGVDTLLFLFLAGFPITVATVGGQLVGKLAWATLLPVLAVVTVRRWRRALPRHTVGA